MKLALQFNEPDYKSFGERLTYKQFIDWLDYFNLEAQEHKKEHYYLAQIAGFLAHQGGGEFTINDYLIKFGLEKDKSHVKSAEDLGELMLQAARLQKAEQESG